MEACLISCLASIRCEFLLRGVSEHILGFVTFLLIVVYWERRGEVQFW